MANEGWGAGLRLLGSSGSQRGRFCPQPRGASGKDRTALAIRAGVRTRSLRQTAPRPETERSALADGVLAGGGVSAGSEDRGVQRDSRGVCAFAVRGASWATWPESGSETLPAPRCIPRCGSGSHRDGARSGLLAGLSRRLTPFLNMLPLLQGLGRGAAPQRRLSCGQTGLRVYLARGSSISLLTWPCHKLRGHAGGA